MINSLTNAVKELIPDLNIPLSTEEFIQQDADKALEKSKSNKPVHEMSNRNIKGIKIMSTQKKQVMIKSGKLLYSDLQRKKWRENKRKMRAQLKKQIPTDELREQWKLRQREYRASFSEERKEELKQRRLARFREKKVKKVSIFLEF